MEKLRERFPGAPISGITPHLRAMIKNLIFDLGAVLLDIDLDAFKKELARIRDSHQFSFNHQELGFYRDYEQGAIDTDTFFETLERQFSGRVGQAELRKAWALILKEPIPESIEFLKSVQGQYNILLLSNTNAAHREQFDEIFNRTVGEGVFYQWFNRVHLSYEMGAIKPGAAIYKKLLQENDLKPEECLFIDDNKDNVEGAKAQGIQAWWFKGKDDWPAIAALLQKTT